MASFHTVQMDDPLEKRDGLSAHDGLFRSATVAQSHLQVRLGKEISYLVSFKMAFAGLEHIFLLQNNSS